MMLPHNLGDIDAIKVPLQMDHPCTVHIAGNLEQFHRICWFTEISGYLEIVSHCDFI